MEYKITPRFLPTVDLIQFVTTSKLAAKKCHTEMYSRIPHDYTCEQATKNGHLGILKWLRAQDPPRPWDKKSCYRAAYNGHLDVLKWARNQDPSSSWDEKWMKDAAWGGQLEVLQWLRAQNPPCPWYPKVYHEAATRDRKSVV